MQTVLRKEGGREVFAVLYEQILHALPWSTRRPIIPGAQSVSSRNRHTKEPGAPEALYLYATIPAKHKCYGGDSPSHLESKHFGQTNLLP